MNLLDSLSLIFLVAAIVINSLLAVLVFREDRKSLTNIIFGVLGIFMSIWLITMFMAPNPKFINISLWTTRLTLFFATIMDTAFFLLAFTIPKSKLSLSTKKLKWLFGASILAMLTAISPYTFTSIRITNGGPAPVPGVGLPLSGGINCFLIIAAIYVLAKKYKEAKGSEKDQLRLVMTGIIIMFTLIISTIFLPVLFFGSDVFVPLTPIYTLFFLILTAYAIVKHHLFNLKVIATEALVIALGITLFAQIIATPTRSQQIVSMVVLATIILLGRYLIKSVRKEVEQREKLQLLTKELGEANEKLKALDVARAEFISIASHQLRTPPATIKWFLSSIISGDYGELNPDVKEALIKTQRTTNSLISLIEDLLNVSRIERGTMEFLFEEVNTEELATITYEQLAPIAQDRKLNLIFNKPAQPLPYIMADKEKLRQVMNNMIDNALKYTKQGSVTISLFTEHDQLRFQVKDTGKGITPDEAKQIFEKFKRGRQSIAESAGLGLGLYVAKVIIEQHKGKIWAESEGEGKGSTFVFTIPIHNDLKKTTLFDLTKQPEHKI